MKKKIFALFLLFICLLPISTSAVYAAETGYSKIVSIKNKRGLTCRIRLKSDKTRTYYIYKQTGRPNDYYFLKDHGCSTCALTTILNSIGGYRFGPAYVHRKLIPQTLGKKYTQPIKLYGIHKVLKKYRISS